jgi:hypothetical protein
MNSELASMRFTGVVGMAVRRWYVVLVGLMLTVPASYLAAQHVAPTYTMTARVVVLVPAKTVGTGGNPYLALGGLDAAVDVVAAGLSSDTIQEELARTGATSDVVTRDAATAAPILLMTVVGPTEETARAGVGVLVDEVAPTLASIQQSAGVTPDQRLRSEVLTTSQHAVVSYKPLIRAAIMVLLAGGAFTLLITALIDSRLRRRKAYRDLLEPRDGPLRVSGRIEPQRGDDAETVDLVSVRRKR